MVAPGLGGGAALAVVIAAGLAAAVYSTVTRPPLEHFGPLVPTPFGDLRFMGSGFKLAHGGGRLDRVAPTLGADTEAALLEAGFDEDDISKFRDEKII